MPSCTPASLSLTTCDTLLEAAIYAFAERGFDGTSVRDIATRVHKPASLIGYYFGTKDGLYLKCFEYLHGKFGHTPIPPEFQDLEALGKDRDLAARALAAVILGQMMDLFEGADDPLRQAGIRMFTDEMHSPRPVLHVFYRGQLALYVQVLKACINSLRPGLSESEVAFGGQCIMGQCLIHRLAMGLNALLWGKTPSNSSSAALMADRIVSFTLAGLGYKEPDRS